VVSKLAALPVLVDGVVVALGAAVELTVEGVAVAVVADVALAEVIPANVEAGVAISD
jgi:hypothetical protein